MIRKIVTALILVPLAIVFVALAVANRQPVLVSFDPFDQLNPAFARALPLYALMLILVIAGVVVGGIAAWVRQAKWRRAARLADARVARGGGAPQAHGTCRGHRGAETAFHPAGAPGLRPAAQHSASRGLIP
jgi:uncharacterized integral membrane protein